MKCYSALKEKYLAICDNMMDIMLGEMNHIEKDKYCMVLSMCKIFKKRKIHEVMDVLTF